MLSVDVKHMLFTIFNPSLLSAGLTDKQLLQPSIHALELNVDRELQRGLSRSVAHKL